MEEQEEVEKEMDGWEEMDKSENEMTKME